jgi:hypothetical protein
MNELGKSMTINGVEYVKRPGSNTCVGCEFEHRRMCLTVCNLAKQIFGEDCTDRGVIYIKKEKEMSNDLVPNWRDLYAAIGRGDEVWRLFSDGSKAKWSELQSVRLGDDICDWEIRKPVKKVMLQHWVTKNKIDLQVMICPAAEVGPSSNYWEKLGEPYELKGPNE